MKAEFSISPSSDELSIDEALLSHKDIVDGFIYPVQDLILKTKHYKKFINDIKQICDLKEYDYSISKNNTNYRLVGEKVRVYTRGNSLDIFVSAYCTSEEDAQKVWNFYKKYCDFKSSTEIFITSYSMNGNNLDDSIKQMNIEDLDYISEQYYPYIDVNIMFNQLFTGNENIFLIVGEPGLGKSKMSTLAIKHAYENPDKLPYDKCELNPALSDQFINVVYVKSVDVLTSDNFWRRLETTQTDIVIIDDLDYMLTKRDSEVMSSDDAKRNIFLNQFLSFTDGVEKHNTKFIITTNQTYDDIDTALLRKGRLFDIIELRKLDKDESLKIWLDNGLKEDEFNNIFNTHEILPADLGSEIAKRLNKRLDVKVQSYLKEEGISKIRKAGRSKKIGL